MVQIPQCGCLINYKHNNSRFAGLGRKVFQGLFYLKCAKEPENVQRVCAHKSVNVQY